MKKPFFTEADCDLGQQYFTFNGASRIGAGLSLKKANHLFDEWLAKGKVVWCSLDVIKGTPLAEVWYGDNPRSHTHIAILVNIQPIEQDSAEKVLKDWCDKYQEHTIPNSEVIYSMRSIFDRAKALLTKPKGGGE